MNNSLKRHAEPASQAQSSHHQQLHQLGLAALRSHYFVENTSLCALTKKVYSNNKCGVKGVYYTRGAYHAMLTCKGKRYFLGRFKTLEEAAEARRIAEQTYFTPILQKYSSPNSPLPSTGSTES